MSQDIEESNDREKFVPLNVSSKFAICGLPIRMDTYKFCTFGCKYCFANGREIMKYEHKIQVADLQWLGRKLKTILKTGGGDNGLLDTLIRYGITFHCGGMSDPFQQCEEKYGITRKAIDICNMYGIHILFSTKSDTVYGANIDPKHHTFQLSVTGAGKDIEPNVPDLQKRYAFYRTLKQSGFRVGIRIQPFIPGVTTLDVVKMFEDADNFTVEGLKVVPQNLEMKRYVFEKLKLSKSDFEQMGLLNMTPQVRLKFYKPFIDYFEEKGIPYSIADNDLHHIGTNRCCCGDNLVTMSSGFDNTGMIKKYGSNYTLQDLHNELCRVGVEQCKANQLFTSNRQEGCVSVYDFYKKRFGRKSSPFSPLFLYRRDTERVQEIDFGEQMKID